MVSFVNKMIGVLAFCAAGSTIGIFSTANAQSLSEIRAQEAEQSALDKEVQYTNSICGTSMSATIDWPSAVNWPEKPSLSGQCDGALGALEFICKTADGKKRAQKVRVFQCAGDGKGPSLSGGTLRYGASPNKNGFEPTKTFLEKNLK